MNSVLGRMFFLVHQGMGRLLQPVQSLSSLPLISLSLGLAASIVSFMPLARELLQYDRKAIAAGETWRILTGHWTHWTAEHFVWNMVVFVALGIACERFGRERYILCLAAGAPIVSLAVWAASPHLQYYRGVSGLDAALFMLAGITLIREEKGLSLRRKIALFILLATALGAKAGYEAVFDRTIFVQDMGGYVPVPVAHLAGGLVGMTVALTPDLETACAADELSTAATSDSQIGGKV